MAVGHSWDRFHILALHTKGNRCLTFSQGLWLKNLVKINECCQQHLIIHQDGLLYLSTHFWYFLLPFLFSCYSLPSFPLSLSASFSFIIYQHIQSLISSSFFCDPKELQYTSSLWSFPVCSTINWDQIHKDIVS